MSALSGTVDIPKIGPVSKPMLAAVGGGAVLYVGWRYWQARNAPAPAEEAAGSEYGDEGLLPGVAGALAPDNRYGDPNAVAPSTDTYGFTGTSNSQWTLYVTTQLSQSARWEYTDIVDAVGNYLNNRPLTAGQIQIVQAAIAVAGYPPEGSHTIIPGGSTPSPGTDTSVTTAPVVTATATSTSVIHLTWTAVPGAARYRMYRSGSTVNAGDSVDTVGDIGGLQADTAYTVQVAAVSASGAVGPKSTGVKVTTKAQVLTAPTGLRVESASRTMVALRWSTVTGASGYRIYHQLSAQNVGSSVDTRASVGGLKPNTSYTFHVRAQDNRGQTGPKSGTVTVHTKK